MEQFLGLSDIHRDCFYVRYFYHLFSTKLPMFDLLYKNWEFHSKQIKIIGREHIWYEYWRSPQNVTCMNYMYAKMMKYLISFPNEHKQLGIF